MSSHIKASGAALIIAVLIFCLASSGWIDQAANAAEGGAEGGYGLSGPSALENGPGGYTEVATARTLDVSGGRLRGLIVGGSVSADLPAGAFSNPVQVWIMTARRSAVSSALSAVECAGSRVLASFGLKVTYLNGKQISNAFPKPVRITVSSPSLGFSGQLVLRLDSASSISNVPAQFSPGSVTLNVGNNQNFVVLAPPVNCVQEISDAVTPLRGTTGSDNKKTSVWREIAVFGLFLAATACTVIATVRGRGVRGRIRDKHGDEQ